MMNAVQRIIDNVKDTVYKRIKKEGKKVLQVELYLSWLEGLDFVLDAIEVRSIPLVHKFSHLLILHSPRKGPPYSKDAQSGALEVKSMA